LSKPSDRGNLEQALDPGLYVVATPIGHASDITSRALRVLAGVDAIACEDTRVTAKLLAIHGISTSLTPYHDHNARAAGPVLVKRLQAGERIALVSDAGTPLISDPGYRLVRACADAGVPVVPIPGPSAVLAALCVSGLPTDRFLFAGFAPPRAGPRRRFLTELAAVPATLVLMESPRRLATSLADMADVLGGRDAMVARELTKLFEEIRRGTLAELADHYREAATPKGEVTVVVAPPTAPPQADGADVDRRLSEALDEASVRSAAEKVAAETGLPKRRLYARALELRRRSQ
jgi:16S rRNA (cytidine1402-2'-O)-methyltransferase